MLRIPENVNIPGYSISFRILGRGRFREEYNYEVLLNGRRLCYMKVFHGRGYYRPWIELYSFTDQWELLKNDNELCKRFFKIFYCVLGEGNSLYIEYIHDDELVKILEKMDARDTWLGNILLEVGFNRFRDWYIPEGFMEGGQKIEVWRS